MLLSLVQIRANALKLKKLLIEDFIGVMDLNLAILLLVSIILLVNWEYLLFQLSVLYLNYDVLENGKILHVLLIISLIIFLLCYSWTKESRTLDKKLNGMKTSEIKKFYWERDVFKPSKAKKAIIYKENDFGIISEIRNLTFQYPKYHLGFFWISRIRCGFKFDISISIKRKIFSEDYPKCCPCCGVSVPSFSHWIFACKELENYRNKSLTFSRWSLFEVCNDNWTKILGCFFRFRKGLW